MFCKKCGKQLDDTTNFCPACGTPVDGAKEVKDIENAIKGTDLPDKKNESWWKKIFRYRNYCILMAILVILAFVAGNAGKEKVSENKIELYDFIDFTEEDVIEKMGFSKNEYGWYPNENSANIICVDGKVYSLKISAGQEEADMLSLCGMTVGSSLSAAESSLSENFNLITSSEIEGGMRNFYEDKRNGYQLAVDYTESGEIFCISYVKEMAVVPEQDKAESKPSDSKEESDMEEISDFSKQVSENTEAEEQLSAEQLLEQLDGALCTVTFAYWDAYCSERILIDLSEEDEGVMFFCAQYYDDDFALISDEIVEATYKMQDGEEKYDIYSMDGTYTEMYFTITYEEESMVLHIFDEVNGSEMIYLEEAYAAENVG